MRLLLNGKWHGFWLALLVAAVVFAVYLPTIGYDYVALDDDVFVVSVTVEAQTPAEAMTLGEARAVARYGESKVLGAWDARELA